MINKSSLLFPFFISFSFAFLECDFQAYRVQKHLPFGPFSLKWLQILLGSFSKNRLDVHLMKWLQSGARIFKTHGQQDTFSVNGQSCQLQGTESRESSTQESTQNLKKKLINLVGY